MLPKNSISRVGEYYMTRLKYQKEMLRAMRDFFDRPDLAPGAHLDLGKFDTPLFNEWVMFDYVFTDGKKMLEKYYEDNPHKLSLPELALYKYLQKNIYGFFKVLEVKMGMGELLEDMMTGDEYWVVEYKGTLSTIPGYVITNRVAKIGDDYMMVGCDVPAYNLNDYKGIEMRIRELLKHGRPNPKMIRKIVNDKL